MGQEILQKSLLEFQEPCLGGGLGTCEHIPGMVGNDAVPILEPGDHAKEGEHSQVKKCFKGEAATKKPDHTLWSC